MRGVQASGLVLNLASRVRKISEHGTKDPNAQAIAMASGAEPNVASYVFPALGRKQASRSSRREGAEHTRIKMKADVTMPDEGC